MGMLFKNIVYVKNNKHFMFLVGKFSGEGVDIVLIFYYVNLGNWNFLESGSHFPPPPHLNRDPCMYTVYIQLNLTCFL